MMTLDQAIGRAEVKASRMEILSRVERGDKNTVLADQLARDAEALRCLVAHVRQPAPESTPTSKETDDAHPLER